MRKNHQYWNSLSRSHIHTAYQWANMGPWILTLFRHQLRIIYLFAVVPENITSEGSKILYPILKTVSLLPPVSFRVRRVLQTARLKNVTAETVVDAMPFLCVAAANDQCEGVNV